MKRKSIASIKESLMTDVIDESVLQQLRKDERKGVQKLIVTYDKNLKKEAALEASFIEMSHFEQKNYAKGCNYIAGIDEAGRGPLAGPVVAAAVILPKEFKLLGLTDSKLLSTKKRDEFFDAITSQAVSYGISVISNEQIDQMNILEATKHAMKMALNKLATSPDHVLIDAVKLTSLPCSSESIIKGDLKSISIAAASILAKVTRDRFMQQVHLKYPIYQFDKNMGYGTKRHIDMLEKYGITPYHRMSFAPVKNNMS